VPLHALRELDAAQARHLDVGDDEIGLQLLDRASRFLAVRRGADDVDVGLELQERGQRAANHGLIFGEEDADHHRTVSRGRKCDDVAVLAGAATAAISAG
jgi:hypothetical protein